jgi:hypothetical protein
LQHRKKLRFVSESGLKQIDQNGGSVLQIHIRIARSPSGIEDARKHIQIAWG